MKSNIILMGPPGAGKGTLAKLLKSRLNLAHISTGDMFREAISAGTPTGKLAASYINAGNLVPDEITIELVAERLSQPDCEAGFILDGFPRTLPQAEALKEMSIRINRPIQIVINLSCDEGELIRRISGRRVCRTCGAPYHIVSKQPKVKGLCDLCGGELYQRADDNEEALKVRLVNYERATKPLLEFYESLGLLENFNSLVDTDVLFDEVSSSITK